MGEIYYIGGSPCSGKSTVAEAISKKFGLYYFKADNFIDKYIDRGSKNNKPICKKQSTMTPEQIWMRPPEEQCEEEFDFYREVFDYVLFDLKKSPNKNGIIAEGCAFLPELVQKLGVAPDRYISITPNSKFQISRYSERSWVPYVLGNCPDKEKAFDNWMERDVLFADAIRRQCTELGYQALLTDGTVTAEQHFTAVCAAFGLKSE